MRVIALTVLLLTLFFNQCVLAASPDKATHPDGPPGKSSPPSKRFQDGELLVKFRPDVSPERKNSLHNKHGSQVLKEFRSLRIQHVKLKKGMTLEEALKLYQSDASVEYAEPNFLYQAQVVPNDAQYGNLWGMAKIYAPSAWNSTTGSPDAVVAVIDSGVDYNHPDLQANMWVNPGEVPANGLDNDGNGYVNDLYGINAITGSGDPMDDHGHGTHVAGTIGAVGNNGVGVSGVNWSVKIIACKSLGASGSGTTSDAISCLDYVKALKTRGVNIVATNNSWGGSGYSQALYDAINAQPDILFVAAAGNDGANIDSSPSYPAGYDLPNIISVAATDSLDHLVSSSNYGKRSVDVGAPGSSILSTMSAINVYGDTSGYAALSGTSTAAPHVTGLAALLKAQDPARDWKQLKNLILSGGDVVGSLDGKSLTGRRINAFGSVGSPTCGNKPLFILNPLPSNMQTGVSYMLSALSINCASPSGAVTVSGTDGTSLELTDPDGDGTFTGPWTPSAFPVTLTFSSPAGSQSLTYNKLKVVPYIPEARQDYPYSQALVATGGTSYSWAITAGALPAGVTLDSATGLISGTAAATGTFSFTAQVTDSNGTTATGTISLVVNGSGWFDEKWGRIYDGDNNLNDQALGVAADAAGNTYVTGQTYNGTTWDVILLKYDTAGNLVWSRSYDGGEDDFGRSVATDGAGHIYVAGASGVIANHLLLKYDATGNLLWAKSWDRGGDDGAYGIATDSSGNVYTVGTYDPGVGDRVLLSKYDADGNTLWTRSHDTTAIGEYGSAIAIDGTGNIVVGGRAAVSSVSGTVDQGLIVKFDGSGNVAWSTGVVNGGQETYIKSVAVDAAGDLYVVTDGYYRQLKKFSAAGAEAWTYTGFSGVPEVVAATGLKLYLAGEGASWAHGIAIQTLDSSGNQLPFQRLDAGGQDGVLGIAADSGGFTVAGYRYNGNDNDIISARFDNAPAIYDLTPTGLDATLNLGSLAYTVKVKNNTVGNPTAKVGLYFSPDALSSTDDYYGYALTAGTVAGGTEKTATGSFYVPNSIPCGTYYLTGVVNYDKSTNETDTTNNAIVGSQYTISRDLAITALSGTVTGTNLTYSLTEKNTGNVDAGSSVTGIYLTTDPVGAPTQYLVTTFTATDKNYPSRYFPAGDQVVFTGTVAVPSNLPPGSYYLTAVADINNTVKESDEGNNLKVGGIVYGPDLTITSFSGSMIDGNVTYTIKVKNNGGSNVAPAVGLYFSADAVASADDYPIALLDAGSITAGAEVTLTGTVAAPAPGTVPTGYYFMTALVDPANVIPETSETNNGATGAQYLIGINPVYLNYSVIGTGTGTVSFVPGGSCRGVCSPLYDTGAMVTLTATPDSGSVFSGWGGACSGTGNCTVTMNGQQAVWADFEKAVPTSSLLAGKAHSGALIGGIGWMWGNNAYGQLGDGTNTQRVAPIMIPALSSTVAMASGGVGNYNLAVRRDGTVLSWGDNALGQLGDGTNIQRSTPVAVQALSDIVTVSAGNGNSAALQRNGTVWGWGNNGYGQVGDGTTTVRYSPVQVVGIADAKEIASGDFHTLAVRTDGTVWGWGYNGYSQLGEGTNTNHSTPVQVPGLSDIIAVAAATYHSVALKADGTVWTWGGNWLGQLGDGTTVDQTTPVQVPGLTGVTAIAAAGASTLALKSDGTVVAWGDNAMGQLGDGTTTVRTSPVPVTGLTGVLSIRSGADHALAMKSDGTVWAWGQNGSGQVGDGTTTSRTVPTLVYFDKTAPTSAASPRGGIYPSARTVTLAANEAATIYYTVDGSTPTTASPVYSAPLTVSGTTTLNFFARDTAGNLENVNTETYTIIPPPVADFSASATTGDAPFTVNFSDTSTGAATSWLWDFGDSSTSTSQNPVHVYANPGSYTVSLTATNAGGSNTRTRSGYITASNPPPSPIQPVYDTALDGDIIKVRAGDLTESLLLGRDISVKISGGYDFPYQSVVGTTTIHGAIRVSSGKVSVENLILK